MEDILSGRGELKENGSPIGDAEYKLQVIEKHGIRSASGTLWADPMVLIEAYEAKSLTLNRMDTGRDIRIIVRSYAPGDFAHFVVDGSPD